ncbi:EscT/YscT/HrcT family type III secretion system export apparatus protein [Izhakiella australiensis]|uniref:EscT/YscT/HrcT family type III secretion system export apparatus protein n=1 Tax=Izhakiella australiensis TaxID=1926881 RepID=A0A1S8YPJ0_9GAMM|nr:type III secretion system export apparatus subunit SctT [Izhakiella australiensis]OON41061.1 EscT/YscT/HrcT family type III secretion system export apparatus protein [Izhakiella australiensis]
MGIYSEFNQVILLIIIGMARILPTFIFLPWFNNQLMGGMIVKNVIICLIVLGLYPIISQDITELNFESAIPIIVKELIIGLLCGCCLALPFWAALAIGEIIDNQRGATISSTMNPGIGVETSVMANFMNVFYSAIFMLSGGMVTLVKVLYQSYILYPLDMPINTNKETFIRLASLINEMLLKAVILVGPVLVSLFLVESATGILSRFAPQLNAFSVALSIKSFIACSVLLIYLTQIIAPQLSGQDLLSLLSGRLQP